MTIILLHNTIGVTPQAGLEESKLGLPEISREKPGANKFILQVASFFPTSKRF